MPQLPSFSSLRISQITPMVFILLAAISLQRLFPPLFLNFLALETTSSLLASVSGEEKGMVGLPLHVKGDVVGVDLPCRAAWFRGFLAQANRDEHVRDTAWRAAIDCDPRYIVLLHKTLPEDRDLAEYAIQAQPAAAEGWFWVAEFYRQENPDVARGLYRRGLAVDPADGYRWRLFGDLWLNADPYEAIKAYLQSCLHGDPGWNGCWQAGNVAVKLGDIENAIRYYRYSGWLPARERADELEAQLFKHQP